MVTESQLITDELVAAVAAAASAHERSVMRRLLGLHVRGRVGERIDRELRVRGIEPSAVAADSAPRVEAA